MICPKCKTENTDNWPVTVDGKVLNGGCQECWESESDKNWWEMVLIFDEYTNS